MDSSRMRTIHCSGRLSYHAHPATHARLPCMPPATHGPSVLHTSPARHAAPSIHAPHHTYPPCHAHPLPHMFLLPHMPLPCMPSTTHTPPCHACPLPHMSPLPCIPPTVNRITDRCKNIALPQLRCGRQLLVYDVE